MRQDKFTKKINFLFCAELMGNVRAKKSPDQRGCQRNLKGQYGRRWPPVWSPGDFVSVNLADQWRDIERGVASRKAADAWRQQQNRQGREEPLCMEQGGRAIGRPGMLWLDLDHGQLDLLDVNDRCA